MNVDSNEKLFEEEPVLKAVLVLELPAVISQLITVAYDMTDIF